MPIISHIIHHITIAMKYIKITFFLSILLSISTTYSQTVEDYFYQLPDSVFSDCNWRDSSANGMANSSIKILDSKNGFLAFKRHASEADFFQIALFKGSNKEDYIMVRNQACEHCCCEEPKSYLYQIKEGTWKEVSATRIPILKPSLFISKKPLSDSLEKVNAYYLYKFDLPRFNTIVTVSLEVCDYIVEDEMMGDELYTELVKGIRIRKMVWNKKQNAFKLVIL